MNRFIFASTSAFVISLTWASGVSAQNLPECYAESKVGDYTANAMIRQKNGKFEPSETVELRPLKTVNNGLNISKHSKPPSFSFAREANESLQKTGWYKWSLMLPAHHGDGTADQERHDNLRVLVNTTDGLSVLNQQVDFELSYTAVQSDPQKMPINEALFDWISDPADGKITLGVAANDSSSTAIYVFNKSTLRKGIVAADSLFADVVKKFQARSCKPV